MPRFEHLSSAELEMIRRFVEEAASLRITPRSELNDDLRVLVADHWPHLLHKLPLHTEH